MPRGGDARHLQAISHLAVLLPTRPPLSLLKVQPSHIARSAHVARSAGMLPTQQAGRQGSRLTKYPLLPCCLPPHIRRAPSRCPMLM